MLFFRRCSMKKASSIKWIICIISIVATVSAAATAFFIYKEKKRKDEEELEHYLDTVIS